MVEAVLVIPLLLMLLLGMVAFAQMIHARTVVLLAANQAARQGAVLYGRTGVTPAEARQQVEATARGVVTNNLAGADFEIAVSADATDVAVTVTYRLHAPIPWWRLLTGGDSFTAEHMATYRIEPS